MTAPAEPHPAATVQPVHPDETPPPADRATVRAFGLTVGAVLVVWAVHNAVLLPWETRNVHPAVLEPALIALRALIWLVPSVLFLRRHDPRRVLVALGVTSRMSPRGIHATAPTALYLTAIVLLLQNTAPPLDEAAKLAVLAPIHVTYLVLKAALEELLMRGFLLRQLVRFMSSRRALAYAVVLSAFMHWPAWLAFQGLGVELVPSTVVVLLLGAVLAWVTIASNSILPAIVVHVANNLIGELLGGG